MKTKTVRVDELEHKREVLSEDTGQATIDLSDAEIGREKDNDPT